MAVQLWYKEFNGLGSGAKFGDWFGIALAAGDFDDDYYADLTVDILKEDMGTTIDVGAVHVLYGSADGITVTSNQFWHQDSAWIAGYSEEYDCFGCSLAAIPRTRHKVYLPLVINNN